MGRCPNCREFGTLEEAQGQTDSSSSSGPSNDTPESQPLADVDSSNTSRRSTGLSELDRVLGGGLVPGSVVLLGGPPGIGKSTLLLQWADQWSHDDETVLYVNGEESGTQIARRAERLNCMNNGLELLTTQTVESFTNQLHEWKPSIVFIDSVQTVSSEESNGTPGSVAQLRAVTQEIVSSAKENDVPYVLVGHVTKEGDIGGPKRLEHMVDTVLYFDDSEKGYRFLRSAKNRFGPTGELGLFEMTESGLNPIDTPGEYFSSEDDNLSGRALTIALQGTRALLVEIQGLVTPSQYGTPQRTATGIKDKRLQMIVAVLEKKLDLPLGTQDIFVNVAGGLSLRDPGTDLAVALAIVSSFRDRALPKKGVSIGELGLTGRIRTASQLKRRLREANHLNASPIITAEDEDLDDENTILSDTILEAYRSLDLNQ
jgi:DNA repair protein RadA/Sms